MTDAQDDVPLAPSSAGDLLTTFWRARRFGQRWPRMRRDRRSRDEQSVLRGPARELGVELEAKPARPGAPGLRPVAPCKHLKRTAPIGRTVRRLAQAWQEIELLRSRISRPAGRRFDIANYRSGSVVHVDMLDPDVLLASAETSQGFDL